MILDGSKGFCVKSISGSLGDVPRVQKATP